jgi:hypothetical protein
MSLPEFITNQDGNTLLAALKAVIPDAHIIAGSCTEAPTEVSIATAFISPSGFGAIAERLEQARHIRLLIGAEPEPEALRTLRKPGDPPQAVFERREVTEGLRLLEAGLRRVRDHQPFSAEARRHLRRMAEMLRAEKLETRRYERGFLHAKAMLLDSSKPGLIAGSSNLTRAGLTTNLELNLGRWDHGVFAQARAWFDLLWDDGTPFDLAAIFEESEQEFPPWLIFLRILWQLYGEELTQEREEAGEVPLTAFQLHGVWRANRILREFGGVIIADEVGLGKTFIGGAILEACARNRQRALLICPAALRLTWGKFLISHNIGRFVEMISYDQLARDRQFHDSRRPDATGMHLAAELDDYALVVVDEAHNYRNPETPYRAAVLRQFLYGQRKNVVLLTATPVNNSLFDLYHLMRYFLRQDSALASRGIVKIYDRFKSAAKEDPDNLSPDFLYPIIDAVTVKRTRGFVKKYYSGETIRGQDGVMRPIVFPKAVPITVRYDLEKLAPGLFDAVADALDPLNGKNVIISFARYAPGIYLLEQDEDVPEEVEAAAGLLRSGLLKRFESSAHAFGLSLTRMLREHDLFLDALEQGKVITTAFLRELSMDDDAFVDLLESSEHAADAGDFDAKNLREAVERDRTILFKLCERLDAVRDESDPKFEAVVEELVQILSQAHIDAATDLEEQRNRKVLLFSYFADTVAWLRSALAERIETDPRLAGYRGRIVAVAGSGLRIEEASRSEAVWGFAPESSEPPPGQADLFDLLITTDVLAEGMNLQQCRNIINYDLPWNPMRLVQRHGRIDRIGSPHPRVFLRTVFPADRLDALLALQARILRKLTQAAKSIGVATLPVDGARTGDQVFAETRAEIERLAAEDASLFDRGGTEAAAQTGEEYRQRLRAALDADRGAIVNLPGCAGSGMRKGRNSGVVFCAEVELVDGRRTFLRFVPAGPSWRPVKASGLISETGTCLRLIDCTEDTPRQIPPALSDNIFEFWQLALEDILTEWDELCDPAKFQPPVRLLNRQVAAFIRTYPPRDADGEKVAKALDILEAPWPRREEALLREQFRDRSGTAAARSLRLVNWILATGLDRFEPPPPLPPIGSEDVRLVCWMALEGES